MRSLQVLQKEVAIPDLVLSSPRVVISAPPELHDQDFSLYDKFESPGRLNNYCED